MLGFLEEDRQPREFNQAGGTYLGGVQMYRVAAQGAKQARIGHRLRAGTRTSEASLTNVDQSQAFTGKVWN